MQWQRSENVKIIYLLYRWLAAILFLAVQSCSMLDIGRTEPQLDHHYAKWWIYLTHWALLACSLQAWLAAFIVTRGLMVDRDDFGSKYLRRKSFKLCINGLSLSFSSQSKCNGNRRRDKSINSIGSCTR